MKFTLYSKLWLDIESLTYSYNETIPMTDRNETDILAPYLNAKLKSFFRILIITLAFLMFVSLFYINAQQKKAASEARLAFNDLIFESYAHSILVPAYKTCRQPPLSQTTRHTYTPSFQECIVTMKQYADIKGLQEEFPIVLHDIEALRQKIKNREL